jgi:hypothetical protein
MVLVSIEREGKMEKPDKILVPVWRLLQIRELFEKLEADDGDQHAMLCDIGVAMTNDILEPVIVS